MESGTNCVGVVALACGNGTTCVVEITCGAWFLLGVELMV